MRQADSRMPWGLGLATDRLPASAPGYAHVALDPTTQIARYFDASGLEMDMGAHGTSKTKGTASVSGGGDGSAPAAQKQDDNYTDYTQD